MLLWLSISSTFAAIAFMVDIIIGGRSPVAWLCHGYEDPRIKDLGIGTQGAYDLVLRRRAAGGWAPRRLVVLRGKKFEPAHRQELAALAVVPADAGWQIDPNFLAPGKALLRFDAKDDQLPHTVKRSRRSGTGCSRSEPPRSPGWTSSDRAGRPSRPW